MCYCNSCKSTYNSFTDHEFVAISKSWMRDNFSPIFLNLSLNAVYPYFMRLKTFWMLCYAWMKIPILMKEKLVICVQNKILKLKYAKVYLLSFICPLSFQVRSAALTALSSDFSGDFSSFQFYLRISICFKLFSTDNVAWSRILFFNSNSFSDPTKQDVFAVIKVLKSKLTFFLLSPVLNYNLLGLKKTEKMFLTIFIHFGDDGVQGFFLDS